MWSGIPSGRYVSFCHRILCAFHTTSLKMSTSLCMRGTNKYASIDLREKKVECFQNPWLKTNLCSQYLLTIHEALRLCLGFYGPKQMKNSTVFIMGTRLKQTCQYHYVDHNGACLLKTAGVPWSTFQGVGEVLSTISQSKKFERSLPMYTYYYVAKAISASGLKCHLTFVFNI